MINQIPSSSNRQAAVEAMAFKPRSSMLAYADVPPRADAAWLCTATLGTRQRISVVDLGA